MIDQCDNKKSLQDQISKRMDPKAGSTHEDSPISKGPVVGNVQIGELSDIVQKLLEEQRDLKTKLNERDNIIADLSSTKNSKRKNTQERERRTKSLKPTGNSKKVGSADNKSLVARRIRDKNAQHNDQVNAIENKIEKARRRKAEMHKELSSKANKINGLSRPNLKERPSSDFDPSMHKKKAFRNKDLMNMDNQDDRSQPNFAQLNVCKARAVESPGYSLSSKIDELNTQSRSKRSNYEYGNDSKGNTSQKYVGKYSNIQPNFDDLDADNDDIHEEQAFMFSLPPDDDDNFSAYSLLGNNMVHRTPITEFDVAASDGGDQIDLLMNVYNRPNVRAVNVKSIPMSDMTTSMGMNHSPNYNDMYMVNKDDNSSGFYQSGNFPTNNYPTRAQNQNYEKFYASGAKMNYNYPGFQKDQYNGQRNPTTVQSKARQFSSNAMGGQMMSNGKLIMSPGNRVNSNIMYVPPQSHPNTTYRNR